MSNLPVMEGAGGGRPARRGQLIWPSASGLEVYLQGITLPVFRDILAEATGVFGFVAGIHKTGIRFVEEYLTENQATGFTLILALWPACPTSRRDLHRMIDLQERFAGRLEVRLSTSDSVLDHPMTTLCVSGHRSGENWMILGSISDLGMEPEDIGEGGVFRADVRTVQTFRNRFMLEWARSGKLDSQGAADIPLLALPEGTQEAADLWAAYQEAVSGVERTEGHESAEIDHDTGEVILVDENGNPVADPIASLGFEKPDPLAAWIADLYDIGQIVSIDKTSRVPPVDVPVNPAAFGDSAAMTLGSISRKVSMRASVIGESDLKEIDKHRGMVRKILDRLSYGLADGLRFVPENVRPLLALELDNADKAGRLALLKAMGGSTPLDIEEFVESRKPDLTKNLVKMAEALGAPNANIGQILEDTLQEAKRRLQRAKGGSLLPELSWTRIAFSGDRDSHASPWGQAASFLIAIARFPRRAMTDGFFMRGLACNLFELVEAMNIADDEFCRDLRARNMINRGREELSIIDRIADEVDDPRERCRLLQMVISDKPNLAVQALEKLSAGDGDHRT
jgi:hypothetical protein